MQILNVCCRCMVLHKFFDDNPIRLVLVKMMCKQLHILCRNIAGNYQGTKFYNTP